MQLFKAQILSHPSFFVANLNNNEIQMIRTIQLFSNQTDAKKWVADQKSKYRVKSSRVQILNTKDVVSARYSSGFLELSLKVKLGIMQDFKESTQSFDVRYWCDNTRLWAFARFQQEDIQPYLDR